MQKLMSDPGFQAIISMNQYLKLPKKRPRVETQYTNREIQCK
eukprot:gene1513-12639_t